jgi:hypothetical protein
MKAYWVFGIAAEPHAQARECSVTVRANVRHDMPARMLLHAELRTPAMFREIDVEVHRAACVPANAPDNACCAPFPVQLEKGRRGRAAWEALGHATPLPQSRNRINVFLDRLVTYRNENLETAILAHVLAHEITHVLERGHGQSANGTMNTHWDIADWQGTKSRSLALPTEDVDLIRRGIARRLLRSIVGSTPNLTPATQPAY